jgi:hypothetical protein
MSVVELLLVWLASAVVPATLQTAVPFDVCAESATWQRPSPDVQARIWNDPRYHDGGSQAYAWTHSFLSSEPDSASISYHQWNMAGLWTEPSQRQCPRRDGEQGQWAEIWALNHRVSGITADGFVYTVTVVPQERGYEIIQFRRPAAANVRIRFVGGDGAVVAEWVEDGRGIFVDAPMNSRLDGR